MARCMPETMLLYNNNNNDTAATTTTTTATTTNSKGVYFQRISLNAVSSLRYKGEE